MHNCPKLYEWLLCNNTKGEMIRHNGPVFQQQFQFKYTKDLQTLKRIYIIFSPSSNYLSSDNYKAKIRCTSEIPVDKNPNCWSYI
jgi:hypothetical protein